MAFEVKEEVSAVLFYKNVGAIDVQESADIALQTFQPVSSAVSPDSVFVDIEGIHSIITRNFTYYTPNCLRNSVPYWTSPYERPVIMHHKDQDGVQVGRVKSVEFVEKTRPGVPGLIFTCNIGDEEGVKGVKNGTLSTVSLGAVIHKATCSICGQDIAKEGECEHQRGRRYEGKLCYWNMEEMEPKELSYVIVPSDRYANTIRIYKPKDLGAKESYNEGGNEESMGIFDNIDLTLTKPEAKPEVQESVEEQVVEEVVEVQEAEQQQEQEEAKVEEVVVEEEPKVEVEEEPKQEPEKEEEVKEEEHKEKGIDDMSKEELADKCKELIKLVAGLQDDVKYLRNKLNEERGVKESLELEVLKMKQIQKMHLAEQVVSLRKELGLREEAIDDLMMMSEESLNSSIKTFMEFKESNTFNVNTLPKIESKALVDEKEDNTIKESSNEDLNKNNSNIDYESQLNNWLKNMTNKKFF
jgi:hypothetical protein